MSPVVAILSLLPGMLPFQDTARVNTPLQADVAKHEQKAIKVIVDGEEVKFGANAPKAINGATMVPFRPLFESLGANVEYDLVHKIVTAVKDNNTIELQIGEKIAKKNGAEITMANAPVLLKGTTYVPLRFVAEALEAKVDFDAATQVITVDTSGDGGQMFMNCGAASQIKPIK